MIRLPFRDREDAASGLIAALSKYRGTTPVVLGIPRGSVPMGRIIADALGGELDVVLVRKLGAPGNPEVAIGAVDERGSVMLNDNAVWSSVSDAYIQREAREQLMLIRDRRLRYGAGQATDLSGRTVIVLDDGLATGATMVAALQSVRRQHPKRLVCAVPVAAPDSLGNAARIADEVVCLATPTPFHAVGLYYENFSAVTDEEVAQALRREPQGEMASPPGHAVRIPVGRVILEGDLISPPSALGLVIFAHGSGSSRHSSRNHLVAKVVNQRGISTLLFDLITPQEDNIRENRFDISLLTQRLQAAVAWARQDSQHRYLPIGLFGASTGAAAALRVAVTHAGEVTTVVSRGGRPELAGSQILPLVRKPILLIVGGADREVLALNRAAQELMGAWARLAVVPGATHLFEEPGALEQAASLAADWFVQEFQVGSQNGFAQR